MKLTFFLIAFSLIFLRFYFGATRHGNSNEEGNMTIKSEGLIEQMDWSGRITLSDDETIIKNISPGGYLKYRNNEKKMIAESNTRGEVTYELYNDNEKLPLNDSSKKLIAAYIKEMISWGFDAEGRVERIYKRGGDSALLAEMANIKMDNVKGFYLDRLFKNDSLTKNELGRIINQIDSMGSDMDKARYLSKFTAAQLKDSLMNNQWLSSIDHINSDMDKANLLKHYIDQDTISEESFAKMIHILSHFGSDMDKANVLSLLMDKNEIPANQFNNTMELISHFGSDMDKSNLISKLIDKNAIPTNQFNDVIEVINHFGSDMDKSNLISKMIDKNEIPADQFNDVVEVINHFGSEMDKVNLYKKVMEKLVNTDDEWIWLISKAANISSDFDKSNLLVEMAQKMPKTENVKAAFLKTAKTINDDGQYGKVMKAVQ